MPEENKDSNQSPIISETISQKTSFLQKTKNFILGIKNWIKSNPKKSIIGIFSLVYILALSTVLISNSLNKKDPVQSVVGKVVETDYLFVLQTDPPDLEQNIPLDKKITFSFNEEVSLHNFEHSLTVKPLTEGTFEYGRTKKDLVFVPKKPLTTGNTYTLTLSKEIRSETGKSMPSDYLLSFSTDLVGNIVMFKEKGNSHRLMSFPTGTEVELEIEKGTTVVGGLTVNIFESAVEQMLPGFIYGEKEESYNGYSYKVEEYKKTAVEEYKMKKLDSFNDLQNLDKFKVKKDTGIYYIEALDGNKKRVGETWVVFNNKGLLVRQDDQKVYLGGQDLTTKKTETAVEAKLYNLKDKVSLLKTETFDEKTSLDLVYPSRLDLVVGKIGNENFVVPVSAPLSFADIRVNSNLSNRNQIFLYTDKPLYKKGDKVYFRGLLRKDNDALYKLPTKTETIEIYTQEYLNNKNVKTHSQKVQVGSGGVFYGQFTMTESFKSDYQTLYASVVGATKDDFDTGWASFEIATYSKPNFDISVKTNKEEHRAKDKIEAAIIGKYNDGKPLANVEVIYGYTLSDYFETDKAVFNRNFNIGEWGGMCGGSFGAQGIYIDGIEESGKKVKLDADGKAVVTIDTAEIDQKMSQVMTVVALKADDKGNKIYGASKNIVHQGDINIFIRSGIRSYLQGEELFATFYSESRSGEKQANKEFSYEVNEVTYDNKTYESIEKTVAVGKTTTDSNGTGVVKLKLNFNEGNYNLKIIGKDQLGNSVFDSKYIYIYKNIEENSNFRRSFYWWERSSETVYLKVMSDKNSYKVGETVELKVDAPEDITALVTFERGRIYKADWMTFKKGENNFEIEVTEDLSPSFTTVFSFFRDGQYYSEGLSLNVPAMHKLIDVKITPSKDTYKPSEKTKFTIVTKDQNGLGISTRLSLSLVDKAIYTLRQEASVSIHSSLYYFRTRMTNASSSLIWIGDYGDGGGGGGGGTEADKLVDTLYWNPNLQTDANGNLTIEVPLSTYETTWRASVIASTDDTKVGQEYYDITVSK